MAETTSEIDILDSRETMSKLLNLICILVDLGVISYTNIDFIHEEMEDVCIDCDMRNGYCICNTIHGQIKKQNYEDSFWLSEED